MVPTAAAWTRFGDTFVIEASCLDWPAGIASIYFTTPCCGKMRNTAILTPQTHHGDITHWQGPCSCGVTLEVWND